MISKSIYWMILKSIYWMISKSICWMILKSIYWMISKSIYWIILKYHPMWGGIQGFPRDVYKWTLYIAIRLVVRSSSVFASSNCDWLK